MTARYVLVVGAAAMIFASLAGAESDESAVSSRSPEVLSMSLARQLACRMVRLKGDSPGCVIVDNASDTSLMRLAIYDSEGADRFVRKDMLCFPGSHKPATVSFRDASAGLPGMILATFEGDTGTGALQMVYMAIAWKEGRFAPVLLEIPSYELGSLGYLRRLTSRHELTVVGEKGLLFSIRYEYVERDGERLEAEAKWSQVLDWDPVALAFYQRKTESERRDTFAIGPGRALAAAHLQLQKVDFGTSCRDLGSVLQPTGVLDVFGR